jgi:hypothetical protein
MAAMQLTFFQAYAIYDAGEIASNSYFSVHFNPHSGEISIYRGNGQPLLTGATCAIHAANELKRVLTAEYNFSRIDVTPATDRIGTGKRVTISGIDHSVQLDVQILISLYDQVPAIVFETVFKNVSEREIVVRSIEPLRAVSEESGSLYWPGASKCLLNGAMYYDAGSMHDFGDPFKKPEPYGEAKGGRMSSNLLSENGQALESWWNAGIFSGYDSEGISIGYVENRFSLGRIQLLLTGPGQISLVAESVYNDGHLLKPSQSITSDKVMMNISSDPYRSLEEYAEVMGRINESRTGSIVNGWCHWFYTLDSYSEDEILLNARFASEHLRKYGMEYIQLDEGYQRAHGEWEGNSRFPHGMKWLAGQIRALGLRPGIWIAPFVISETTDLFRNHPDWLLKNEDGSPKRIGPWPGEDTEWYLNEAPRRYALDITHSEAEKWFTDLIDTICNNWGYEMIKVDFVAWTVFSADRFHDPSATPAEVYRKAFEIIRKTAGNKCHVLDCGPGHITTGPANSMRIEYDQNYGFRSEAWKQYFQGPSSSAGALGKRYYFHNRTWTNDIDHLCIDLLSTGQAQAAASLIALSGGNTIAGDRLATLDNTKLEILKKVFPSAGLPVLPIDLLDSDPQTAFVAAVRKSFDEWTVAGFFNPDLEHFTTRRYPLQRLNLEAGKTYLCYDFWEEYLIGEIRDTLEASIHPGGVRLLSLHEKRNLPQVVSTNRHIMQGAVELENAAFDTAGEILHGTSTGPVNSTHSVMIYIPESYDWSPVTGKLFDDFGSYSVKKVDHNMLRIDLRFSESERIEWKVPFIIRSQRE